MKIAVIVVLYNKKVNASSTLKFFLNNNLSNISVYVYDNSVKALGNQAECERNHWTYLTQGKNVGISNAYNQTIDYVLKNNTHVDYFMMLDDDANLTKGYFNYLEKILKKYNVEIGVPIIKANGEVLSPCKVGICGRISSVASLNSLNDKNLTAINNGMIINKKIFKTIHYNSKLFVDYVDHDFIRQARKKMIKIFIFNYVLSHNMTIVDKSIDESTRLKRFTLYSKDLKEYYVKSYGEKCYVRLHLLNIGIRYFIEYNNIKFLEVVFK